MFVTAQNFLIPPYKIPSLTGPGEGTTFSAFVDQEERKYLLEVLGDNLYTAFTEGLPEYTWSATVATVIGREYAYGNDVWEALSVQTGTAPVEGVNWTLIEEDNRWLLLKNGNYYSMNDKRYYWDGMVNACKALIYSKWIEYNSKSLTGNGFVIPKHENNIAVDPNQDICRSWNDWSDRVGDACRQKNTLYGYLYYTNLDSGTFDDTFDETFTDFNDYLNYEFQGQGNKNMFDFI
jgi:hypothetical protein